MRADQRGRWEDPRAAALEDESSYAALPMRRFVADALASHGAMFGPIGEDALVFTSPDGGPLSRSNFRVRSWVPTLKRAGVQPARFHLLHHHAGTAAAEVRTPPTSPSGVGCGRS